MRLLEINGRPLTRNSFRQHVFGCGIQSSAGSPCPEGDSVDIQVLDVDSHRPGAEMVLRLARRVGEGYDAHTLPPGSTPMDVIIRNVLEVFRDAR